MIKLKLYNKKGFIPTPENSLGDGGINRKTIKHMPQCQKKKSVVWGFTLIELMVAMAIFMVVSIISVSIFLTAIQNQRRDFQVQNLQDNARYIIETMTKEIRMNREISSPLVTSKTDVLTIINQDDTNRIRYKFINNSLTRYEKDRGSLPNLPAIGDGELGGSSLNSSRVNITGKFYVVKEQDQERVTITMTLSPNPSVAGGPQITVQNTITVR